MKAYDFISDVGDMLGEDFTYGVVWTRANVLSYLRKTLRRFAELSMVVDQDSLRYVDTTTGEANVPADFLFPSYVMYDSVQLDVVQPGELDFVTGTWTLGTTGTSPLAATIMGGGKDAIVRVTPVPTDAVGPFGFSAVTSVTLASSSEIAYTLSVDTSGVLTTTLEETDLITNGDMELDSNWNDYDGVLAGGLVQSRSNAQRNSGSYSRVFTANGVDGYYQGIKSDVFTTTTGIEYAWKAHVYPDLGNSYSSITVSVRKGDDSGTATVAYKSVTNGAWNEIYGTYTETAGGAGAYITFSSGPEPSGTFYIDDVIVVPAGTGDSIVLTGGGTYWDLSVDGDGVLSTTASSSTTGDSVLLIDANSMHWSVEVDSSGVITTNSGYGKLVRIEVDGVDQDFTSDYGTVSNAYAEGSATTPDVVARLDGPYGVVTMGRISTGSLHVWYKGLMSDTPNSESELYLNECFLPVIQHGVLALAYAQDCAGRDDKKAKLLDEIFKLECESIKRMFNRK